MYTGRICGLFLFAHEVRAWEAFGASRACHGCAARTARTRVLPLVRDSRTAAPTGFCPIDMHARRCCAAARTSAALGDAVLATAAASAAMVPTPRNGRASPHCSILFDALSGIEHRRRMRRHAMRCGAFSDSCRDRAQALRSVKGARWTLRRGGGAGFPASVLVACAVRVLKCHMRRLWKMKRGKRYVFYGKR